VEPGRYVAASIVAGEFTGFLNEQRPILSELAKLDMENLVIQQAIEAPDDAITIPMGDITAYLPLADMVDLEKERGRLTAELEELEQQIGRVSNLLASEFAQKAPPQIVERERDKLARFEASRKEVLERLEGFE
jgi:valyl-tRNA synthetase